MSVGYFFSANSDVLQKVDKVCFCSLTIMLIELFNIWFLQLLLLIKFFTSLISFNTCSNWGMGKLVYFRYFFLDQQLWRLIAKIEKNFVPCHQRIMEGPDYFPWQLTSWVSENGEKTPFVFVQFCLHSALKKQPFWKLKLLAFFVSGGSISLLLERWYAVMIAGIEGILGVWVQLRCSWMIWL